MSSGRRYNDERKLNMKKVIGVVIALAVLAMMIISISKLLEPKKEEELSTSTYYFTAYKNGKWGVISQTGSEIIPFEYTEMIIIPDKTKDVFITLTDVNTETGTYKTKVFNKKGEEQFKDYELVEAIDNYDENQTVWYESSALRVRKDGKYGLINLNGKEILECKYDNIYSIKGISNSLLLISGEKQGLASDVGEIIVPADYKEIRPAGKEYTDGYIVINSEGKYGLIDNNKEIILETVYDDIKPISGNNLYVVKEGDSFKIINQAKETIIDGGFDEVLQISGENIVVKRSLSVGVITTSNVEKIPFEYQDLKDIGNDHFIAKKEDKYGIIDGQNKTVVDFNYIYMKQRKDTDFVEADKTASETDIYNKDMELKLTGIVSEVNTEKGYINIRIGEAQKYYNFKFEEKEEKDIFTTHTLFLVKKDGKYGYQDKDGKQVVDYIYDDAKQQNEYGYAAVKKGNVWGCINKDGNVALEPSANLDNNLVIDFINKWHLAEDLRLNYYEQ